MGRYDNPNATIRRCQSAETVAGANGVSAKWMEFQKLRLKAVHHKVTTAGTSAGAGNAAIIKAGTTALATFTLGTTTAGANQTINLGAVAAALEVASLTDITCTNGTDATGRGIVSYEYEILPDASQSA